MRKKCESCKYDDRLRKPICDECYNTSDAPTKWEPAAHYKPDTNADRIRAMSDEELAKLIVDNHPMHAWNKEVRHIFFDGPRITHKEAWLQWLQQPAEGE